jgi:hypothetical protein
LLFLAAKRIAGDTLGRMIDGGDVSTQRLLRASDERYGKPIVWLRQHR